MSTIIRKKMAVLPARTDGNGAYNKRGNAQKYL